MVKTDLPVGHNQRSRRKPVQPCFEKYFAFSETQIRCIDGASCPGEEGRFAIVTNAGRDAVDAVVSIRRTMLAADGEVVWSSLPDAGVKLVKRSTNDGDKRARSPGRARSNPLKPLRG